MMGHRSKSFKLFAETNLEALAAVGARRDCAPGPGGCQRGRRVHRPPAACLEVSGELTRPRRRPLRGSSTADNMRLRVVEARG